MTNSVIILGGGIGGMSAAHELIERGFSVDVYELLPMAGGKARSFPVPGSGKNGRLDLPGEHGFRFFPRFYRHVTDTMSRIPYGSGSVADNLVDTTRCQLARFGRHAIDVTARSPRTINDVRVVLDDFGRFLGGDVGLSHEDLAVFGSRVWQIVTSCRERRMTEYERLPWWDFIEAERRSLAYQKLLGHGITRSLVAAKAHEASTKTIGNIFVQLLFDIATPGPSTDRVLNGPTNDVWVDPWRRYLEARGVRYHSNAKATALDFDGARIRSVTIEQHGTKREVTAGDYVLALPIEDVIDLITPRMIAADPALGALFTLDDITEWMNGIQLYLTEDVPVVHGHTIYVDSPWALTSVSQAQFWRGLDLAQFADGRVRGIISIDISEWEAKGLFGKAARDCTRDEIKVEVWEQLKRSLNYGDYEILKDEYLHSWSLDPDIQFARDGTTSNEEPLLVNLVDTWRLRPEAVSRIPNLFLASDYVRTFTDLATMEAANEAARRAVNGILDARNPSAPRCNVWDLHEPELFAPWRELDFIRYAQGLPWDDRLARLGLSLVDLTNTAFAELEAASERHPLYGASADRTSASPFQPIVASADRMAGPATVLDIRQQATSLMEQMVRRIALQMPDAARLSADRRDFEAPRHIDETGTGRERRPANGRGRVRIVARKQ